MRTIRKDFRHRADYPLTGDIEINFASGFIMCLIVVVGFMKIWGRL